MLDERTLEEIKGFLDGVNKPDLYAYYGLSLAADAATIDAAIKKRRGWAQGQQANPKHKGEALFLIRNNAVLRRVLLEEAAAYREAVGIDEPSPAPTELEPLDPYAVLGTSPHASAEELVTAYRERVRYLRVSLPPDRLKPALDRVAQAWAAVGTVDARRRYDATHRGDAVLQEAPPPAVHEVSAPVRLAETRTLLPAAEPPARLATSPRAAAPSGPRLEVDLPERELIELTTRPHRFRVVIRNAGVGAMPGRLLADRPWVEITQPVLDPGAASQVRVVTIDPEAVPPAGGTAVLSIVLESGERRTCTLTVRHAARRALPVAPLAVVAGLAVFALGFWLVSQGRAESRVVLRIAPAASHVYVDGQERGQGATVELTLDRSVAHTVRVEAEGREPHEEVLPVDGPAEIDIALDVVRPGEVELGREAQAVILDALTPLAACFAAPDAPPVVQATFVAHVSGAGEIRDVAVEDASYTTPAAEACVRTVFSTLSFPRSSAPVGVVRQRLSLPMPERAP